MNNNEVTVKRGITIFTSKPFAYVLTSKCNAICCDNCLKSGKLSKCSGCQYVYYCDRNCQKESWPIHKAECANLKRISPKIIPDAARLMARIIIKLNQGGANEVGYYCETKFRKFKDLMSHYSDIKKDPKRMEHFISLCGVLLEFLGEALMPNTAELIGIYGRICINSFNILDLDMNSIGVGIYLGASVIDHSCKPNAVVTFEGTTIIVRTLIDLPYLDWSQADLDVSKICLEKQKDILHSFNIQHIRTLDTAFLAAVNLEYWEDAELYSKQLLPGYLLYYGEVHPLIGLLYLTMGKIQLHLRKLKQALEILKKASAVLTITHGDKHPIMREELRPLLYQAIIETTSNNNHNDIV
ncbi:SET and MYND domain-containing protein 3 [Harpegnathos saltator]|uniref:SET and MYND domain-containing protein 3 n=1 Tax=Harpegnathos saltator TaxID=610380 RepID=E2C2G5_HARSA|nr:SET and MYND domain-containing protein 3 [Harpegnathos saltator]